MAAAAGTPFVTCSQPARDQVAASKPHAGAAQHRCNLLLLPRHCCNAGADAGADGAAEKLSVLAGAGVRCTPSQCSQKSWQYGKQETAGRSRTQTAPGATQSRLKHLKSQRCPTHPSTLYENAEACCSGQHVQRHGDGFPRDSERSQANTAR